MKKNMLGLVKEVLAGLTGANRFSKQDVLLLKTSLMLAAVDGEVSAEEVACFKEYAETCRGHNADSFDELWNKALRSAGYLMLQSRFLSRDDLVTAFVKESESDFVERVKLDTAEERDRTFAFLERMAQADGEYSETERACLAALTQAVKAAREQALSERYSRSSVYGS